MRKIVLGMSMLLGCFLLISLSLRFLVQGPKTIRFYTILQNYAYCSGQEKRCRLIFTAMNATV